MTVSNQVDKLNYKDTGHSEGRKLLIKLQNALSDIIPIQPRRQKN